MSESETGISDLFADMDLEETNDTGYEQDVDVEIIDGFYHQNVAFMNEKVQVFADYWIKLYSNCCLQRDYAVELLNDKKPEEAKAILQDWPDTCGAPYIPQLLCETPVEPKRKKRSALSIECDAVSLIHQMKENYITGNSTLMFQMYFQKVKSPYLSMSIISNVVMTALRILKIMLFKMHLCMVCGSVERSRSFKRKRV